MSLLNNVNLKLEEDVIDYMEDDQVVKEIENPLGDDIDELNQITNEGIIAHESLDILYNLNSTELTQDYIKNSIIYTCGRLGMNYNSVMTDIKTEDFNLHTEGVAKKFIDKILEVVKNIWMKIKDFFSKIWIKIQAKYYSFTANIFNLRKKVYGLRNKSDILMSRKEYESFVFKLQGYGICLDDNQLKGTPTRLAFDLSAAIKTYCSKEECTLRLNLLDRLSEVLPSELKYELKVNRTLNDIELFNNRTKLKNMVDGLLLIDLDIHNTSIALRNSSEIETEMQNSKFSSFAVSPERDGQTVKNHISNVIASSKDVVPVSYSTFMNLAEAVDECKGFIDTIQKRVFKINKNVSKFLSDMDKSKLDNDDSTPRSIKELLDLANFISRTLFRYIRSMIQNIQTLSNLINNLYKHAKTSTNLGITTFYSQIKSGDIKTIPIGTQNGIKEFKINNPGEWSLVDKGEVCYIDPGSDFWKFMKQETGIKGGLAFIAAADKDSLLAHLPKDSNTDLDIFSRGNNIDITDYATDKDKLDSLDAATRDGIKSMDRALSNSKLGIILLDTTSINKDPIIQTLFGITGNINFIYYHELGHLLTGQHESTFSLSSDFIKDLSEGFSLYATNPNENKADAYACLKCTVPPEKVVKIRKEIGLKMIEDNIHDEDEKRRFIENIERLESVMLKNIQKEIGNMRSIAKLTPYQYIKSKLAERSNNK